MKYPYKWFAVILCSALFISCAHYMPTDSTVGNMSVKEARKVIAGLKNRINHSRGIDFNAYFTDGGSGKIFGVRVISDKLIFTDDGGKEHAITLSEIPHISQSDHYSSITFAGTEIRAGAADPKEVANAVYVLRRNAIQSKKDAEEFGADFAASLADYRKKADANTTLPEEANKFKVQAEGAVRDKEFDDAADFYAKALKVAPWWPAGHFNRALVLGEAGDYGLATREMNYYLQLLPDAPNARAAQNKIYDWERLDSK